MKLSISRHFILLPSFLSLLCTIAHSALPPPLPLAPSSKILFYIALGSHSHRTAMEPLAHKLVEEGHQVTFLTAIHPTQLNPKFVEFSTSELTQFYETIFSKIGDAYFPDRLADKYANASPFPPLMAQFENLACSLVFQSPEFKSWLNQSHFDLVVIEHSCNKCAYSLAYKWGAPVILFSASGLFLHEEDVFGFPVETSWLPIFAQKNVFTQERTFYDKLYSVFYNVYSVLYSKWIQIPTLDTMTREVIDMPQMPSIEQLEKNLTKLMFINTHASSDYAKSLPPMIIPVGGMHCNNTSWKSLPKDLEEFIDGSGEAGFIYVSFGTLISMSKVPSDLMDIFFEAVENRKTRFIWKWDTEPPTNLPKNVMTAKWFPQQELLGHPKIKAFVTHGGLMSTQQAIYFGVPMIVVPMLFDQPYNSLTIEHHGIGIHLEISEMRQNFNEAINRILQDDQYQRNSQILSQKFRDRPMAPVDTASWWTNYILKYKNDTDHLKPLGIHQSWFERRLLDVWLFILGIILIILFIVFKISKNVLLILISKYRHSSANGKLKTN